MTSHCPHCNVPLDPTHAPVARIRGAKVVTFCSAECAGADARGEPSYDRAATTPVAAAAVDEVPKPVAAVVAPEPIVEPEPSAPLEAPTVQAKTPPRSSVEQIDLGDDDLPLVQAQRSPARQKKRRQIIAVLSIIFLGGMAIAIIEAVSPSKPSTADARGEKPDAQASKTKPATTKKAATKANTDPSAPAKAKKIDPKLLYDNAVAELRKLLSSPSPRVRREAAMALARLKDPAALALLKKAMHAEPSRLVQMKVAYALARAGDVDGRAKLVLALKAKKRVDVRLDAAKMLIQLGDKAGREQLWGMMSFAVYRLGAAALLARIGDKKGTEVLKKALKHRWRSSIRMRAAVALGLAGHKSVLEKLLKIVKDQRYRVRAAHALAVLKHPAAIPELVAQLDMPSLRVDAALALRRLDHKVKLEPVASGLYQDNDVSKIKAAEAIMILVGPRALAERD